MLTFLKRLGNLIFVLVELFSLYVCVIGMESCRNDIGLFGLFAFVSLFIVRVVVIDAFRSRTKTKLWIRKW